MFCGRGEELSECTRETWFGLDSSTPEERGGEPQNTPFPFLPDDAVPAFVINPAALAHQTRRRLGRKDAHYVPPKSVEDVEEEEEGGGGAEKEISSIIPIQIYVVRTRRFVCALGSGSRLLADAEAC